MKKKMDIETHLILDECNLYNSDFKLYIIRDILLFFDDIMKQKLKNSYLSNKFMIFKYKNLKFK